MPSASAMLGSYEMRRQLATSWATRASTSYPWPRRARPNLAGKPVCTLYFCSMDYCLELDDRVIQTAAALAAEREGDGLRTPAGVLDDLRQALLRARESGWRWQPDLDPAYPYSSLLQRLLVRAAQPGDRGGSMSKEGKLRLGHEPDLLPLHLDLVDFLGELFRRCGGGDVRVGGAAALMALALTRVCPPGQVAIWPAFLSPAQALLFPPDVRCLHLGSDTTTRPVRESGRPGNPESHSFPFEHGVGVVAEGLRDLSPAEAGRVIVTAPPLYFDDGGLVRRDLTHQAPPVGRLLFADEAGSRVRAVGREWKTWILAGLQGIQPVAEKGIEGDLAAIPPDVTLHVEVAGTRMTPWLVRVLKRYVDSLGIGHDELAGLAGGVRDLAVLDGQASLGSADWQSAVEGADMPMLFERAAWLAETLDLERLYLHGHVVDLVIRRDRKALESGGAAPEMEQEMAGTLFAKVFVARQAADALASGHPEPAALGLRPAAAPAAVAARRNGPLPLAVEAMARLLEKWGIVSGEPLPGEAGGVAALDKHWATLRQGWFRAAVPSEKGSRACMVAVVPVVWFLETPARPLRTTGLGDVTSALSFYFGDYAVDPQTSKRSRFAAAP